MLKLTSTSVGQYGQDIYTLPGTYFRGHRPPSVNMYWRRFRIGAKKTIYSSISSKTIVSLLMKARRRVRTAANQLRVQAGLKRRLSP
jgi:hypothetical protein